MDIFERLLRWRATMLDFPPSCSRIPERLLRSATEGGILRAMQVCRRLVGVEFDHYVLQFAVMLRCRQDVVAISLDHQLKHRRRFIDWEDKVNQSHWART